MSIAVGLAWYAQSQKECEDLRAEIDRLRLTDAEREAVAWAEECADSQMKGQIALTLRGLLERLGGGR